MTLKLNNPIWHSPQRRAVISKAVFQAGVDFGADVRENMKKSIPRGRVYRRGLRIHRASAKGQPPALDTKALYNSVNVRRVAEFRVRIRVAVPYAKYLEPPAKLHRPFFKSTLKKNERRYKGNINRAVRGLY